MLLMMCSFLTVLFLSGLSFSDWNGNRVGLHTFHFNLRFDVGSEMHSPNSIWFLETTGLNFERLKAEGCDQKKVVDGIKCLLNDKSRKWLLFQGLVLYLFKFSIHLGLNI